MIVNKTIMNSRTEKIMQMAKDPGSMPTEDVAPIIENFVVVGTNLVPIKDGEDMERLSSDSKLIATSHFTEKDEDDYQSKCLYYEPSQKVVNFKETEPIMIITTSEADENAKRNIFNTEPSPFFEKNNENEHSRLSSNEFVSSESEYLPDSDSLESDNDAAPRNDNLEITEEKSQKRKMPKKGECKRRYRNPKIWKFNVAKQRKNSGKNYINVKGKEVQERKMRPPCSDKCRKKCSQSIEEIQRNLIFEKFWAMGDYNRQSAFIGKYVKRVPKKRQIVKPNGEESRRSSNLLYNLPNGNAETVVCKTMFLNTLGITDMWITTAMKKIDLSAIGQVTPDKRGTHKNRPNRIPEETRKRIKEHIEMFPTIDSHYCRSRTNKQYLEQGLNISKMYRFYLEWLKENNYDNVGTERQYREIFNREYNISFWIPKKDMCDLCYAYEIKTEKSEEDETLHVKHLERKKLVRDLKERDKEESGSNTEMSTACFDLQKVILIPQKEASQFYYKCKLSIYNFTVFECSTKEGFCYIWTEQIAKRGANEIASCLFNFIEKMVTKGKTTFHLYSDNCVGQNKNRIIVLMYLYAAKKFHINIVHRFFEQGHTQNENDSIHALIEKNKQGQDIFTPDQFIMIVKLSKVHGKPYIVKEMTQKDFIDFKSLEKNYSNFCKDMENNKISWNSIKEFRVDSENLDSVKIKYEFNEEEKILNLNSTQPTSRRSCKRKRQEEPTRAYNHLLGLPKKKFDHLKFLSSKVPEIYKQFYDSLTCVEDDRQCDDGSDDSD